MNENTLYLAEASVNTRSNYNKVSAYTTYIVKYSMTDEKVKYEDFTRVSGRVLNQFSMDEYEGYFRIATTSDEGDSLSSNNVYVLDKELNIVGRLEGLAQGETIYGVRFDGERGYVVTFKQIDPLFVIDLSKPDAPKVLGELKVPGFSEYLHPIGDNLVVGIGYSTVENILKDENGKEVVTNILTAGIKLSLFDVSNPKSPVEINHIIIGTVGSSSEALSDHKAVMVDKKRNILAVPVYLQFDKLIDITPRTKLSSFQGAYVFGIENGKLVGKAKLGKIDIRTGEYNGGRGYDMGRVCYIGDEMYYIYENQVNIYNMEKFKCIGALMLE